MASFSVDDDLDKAWSRTMQSCQEIAEWNLKSTGRAIDVNDVIDKIRPKSKDPELKDKAKDYLGKTLVCLQKFGSVIAQAAGAVFGPSQQVMNGISFLIDVTQEYSKVFNGFVTIMERISAFLGRLKVYLDEKVPDGTPLLDKRLRSDVYEVLHHFILVLAHSQKLMNSKMAKAKLVAGLLFFGDDQGVKGSLASLEFKIANVSRMEITVILQKVSEEARNVRRVEQKIDKIGEGVSKIEAVLLVEQDHRLTKEQSEQNVRRIKETLQPDDPEAWMDMHNTFQSQVVENTGAWLLENHASFQRWLTPKETSEPVFVLSGGEGYGKSCLSSSVIHHLLEKYPKGRGDHRVAIAYYYFRKDAKEKSSVNKAIRDILYQLTQYDTAYAKKMGSAMTDSQDLNRTLDLWKVFIKDMSTKLNNTFFVVLDGIDEPESEEGRPLATIIQDLMSTKTKDNQLQIRFFVSGRPAEIRKIEERAAISIPEVSLGSKPGNNDAPINEADIVQFITSRLKNMDVFQTSANEAVSALQSRIPNVLAAGVKGDFVRLGYKLDEISKCTRVRQIEQILERANETREDAIDRQITGLNVTLSRYEIEDLNEVLNWLLGAIEIEATGWVDAECLEGVLLLKTGTPAVVRLAKQIKNKYSSLLDLDKLDFVTLVSDDIRQYLLSASKQTQLIQPQNNEVQAAEVAIVKRVISTFCGDDLYKRFNFDSFFESMGGEKAAKVRIDERDMHVKILQTCLVALCDKPNDENLDSLREYARMWFVEHLGHVDREVLDATTVKWIRTQLARLLVESGPIDAWWNEEYFDELQGDWLDDSEDEEGEAADGGANESDEEPDSKGGSDDSRSTVDIEEEEADDEEDPYIDIVAEWLRDSPIEGIESTDRSWLIDTLSEKNPTVLLLGRVLRRLGDRWFSSTPSFSTYTCVDRLYWQIFGSQKPWTEERSLEDIETVISWARKELPHIEGDAQWAFRAAVTFKNLNHFEAAVTSAQKCLDEQPEHWRVRLCMAESLAGSDHIAAACKCYQTLDNSSAELRDSDDAIDELYWKVVLPGLADCYVSLNDLALAADIYQRVMDHYFGEVEDGVSDDADDGQYSYLDAGEDDFSQAAAAATKLMSVWYQQENFTGIHNMLESLKRTDTGYSTTRLTGVMQYNATDSSLHNQLRTLVIDAESFHFINNLYIDATGATGSEYLDRSLALRYFWGMLNWVYGSFADSQERSFDIWKDIIETEIQDNAEAVCLEMRINACMQLPKALLHRAKELGLDSPTAISCIDRLKSIADRISAITDDRNEDPELTLGRYYHLIDDQARAKSALAKRMKDIFKDWDEGSYGFYQHLALAHTFTAINDDENALAAWSLLAPYPAQPVTIEDEEQSVALNAETDVDNHIINEDRLATAGADVDSDSDNDNEADSEDEPSTTTDESDGSDEEGENAAEIPRDQSQEAAPEQVSKLSGWLNSTCDGCDSPWSYVDDIYCCRDCLDVQFDKKCYTKLKAGLLNKAVCHPEHELLHIPPFDEAKWRQLVSKDAIEVGGKEIPRLVWLAAIRETWGVTLETLKREEEETSAAAIIGEQWKAYQARKSQQKDVDIGTGSA